MNKYIITLNINSYDSDIDKAEIEFCLKEAMRVYSNMLHPDNPIQYNSNYRKLLGEKRVSKRLKTCRLISDVLCGNVIEQRLYNDVI